MRSGITFTKDTITPGMKSLAPRLHSAVAALMEFNADVATAHMKQNAPWTDQTGNARAGLNAQAFTSGDQYVIVLYHTMPYGVWLEVRWSGRYAIIIPTIDSVGPQVMMGLRQIISRMR